MRLLAMMSMGVLDMIIDSSAILALLLGEEGAETIAREITKASKRLMSALSVLETGIVIEARKGISGGKELDLLLYRTGIEVVPFTPEQAELARSAWRKYGKGNHRAKLNLGDCCSYALAKYSGEPLLYKGNDFSYTDIKAVVID